MLENLDPNASQRRGCRIQILKETLSPEDAQRLEDAVMNPKFPAKSLEKQLQAVGIKISDTPIYRHREKRCPCWNH